MAFIWLTAAPIPPSAPKGTTSPSARGEMLLARATLRVLETTALAYDAPVLDVGAGHSLLLPGLLAQGYANLIAADPDADALDRLRQQLPPEQTARVLWVVDDVANPQRLPLLDPVLLWHDAFPPGRADPEDTYWRLLHHMVGAQGWALLGGPPAELATLLGTDYSLRHVFDDVSFLASGEQLASYALFQRNLTSRQGHWK